MKISVIVLIKRLEEFFIVQLSIKKSKIKRCGRELLVKITSWLIIVNGKVLKNRSELK